MAVKLDMQHRVLEYQQDCSDYYLWSFFDLWPGTLIFWRFKDLLKSHCENCNQMSHRSSRVTPGGGNQNCSNRPGHVIKMAAVPVYGKNLKIVFSWISRLMVLSLVYCMSTWVLSGLFELWPWFGLDLVLWRGQIWENARTKLFVESFGNFGFKIGK